MSQNSTRIKNLVGYTNLRKDKNGGIYFLPARRMHAIGDLTQWTHTACMWVLHILMERHAAIVNYVRFKATVSTYLC
jgi:hypothetical protein